MLGRLSNFMNQTLEALAPSQSNLDDFEFHWRATTGYFLENRDAKAPLKSTAIPGHLDSMLDILSEEESRFFESHSGGSKSSSSSSSSSASSRARPSLATSPSVAATGPCMEFLLQNKILETLYTLSRADCPPGMRHKVLDFFTKLLSRVRQPILPHVHVYKPVQRLVESCGRVRAGPNELEEILFLCTLVAKLKQDSYLVNFFLEAPEEEFPASRKKSSTSTKRPENLSKASSPVSTAVVDASSNVSTLSTAIDVVSDDSSDDFALVTSLLSLSESPDAQVSIKACEGLLLVASLPEADAARILVDKTDFTSALTRRLIKAYRGLPTELTLAQLDPLTNEAAETHWGLRWGSGDDGGGGGGVMGAAGSDSINPAVKRRLNSFLSLFDYVDQLMNEAYPAVSEALATKIKTDFLEDVLEAHLLSAGTTDTSSSSSSSSSTHYRHPVLATVLITRLVTMIRSPFLLNVFVRFLLGDDDSTPESPIVDERNDSGVADIGQHVRRRLIERCECDAADETLTLVTLRLFQTLLTKPEESIYQNLLLRNLIGRNYADGDYVEADDRRRRHPSQDPSISGAIEVAVSLEGESTTRRSEPPNGIDKDLASFIDGLDLVPFGVPEGEEAEEESVATMAEDAEAAATAAALEWTPQDAVVWFLHLIPESARSCDDGGVENGYEIYLMDAHHLLSSSLKMFGVWNWPSTPVGPVENRALSASSPHNAQFFEGSFIRMLLSRMERILSGRQSYDVNLQVTALVAAIAAVPHPNLDEYWTNPLLPLRHSYHADSDVDTPSEGSVKTPATVLTALTKDLEVGVETKFASVAEFRRSVAKKKEGMMNPVICDADVKLTAEKTDQGLKSTREDEAFLEGAILLEEFCKELSSLVLVKDQLLSAKNS